MNKLINSADLIRYITANASDNRIDVTELLVKIAEMNNHIPHGHGRYVCDVMDISPTLVALVFDRVEYLLFDKASLLEKIKPFYENDKP